ncbi:AraC family transcriptional regulator [Clostridioides difficile]|nr:AraC family transcriptional regulator [Clostridioides difficile]
MAENNLKNINNQLFKVPNRIIEINKHSSYQNNSIEHFDDMINKTNGKGKIDIYSVFPGIEVSFNLFSAENILFSHKSVDYILEINYCHDGRIGWDLKNGTSLYLGTRDLALHTTDFCSKSNMNLPLKYYEGITVSINIKQLQNHIPYILTEANINIDKYCQKLFSLSNPLAISANEDIDNIFSPLYRIPLSIRESYCKVKIQELLLYLSITDFSLKKHLTYYISQQTEIIKEIHTLLTNNLEIRYTIEELSKKYLINSSTLKETFKFVYGMPIGNYMKNFRIKKAMELLLSTNDNIASIASKVGYITQGKFTSAFKDVTNILPTEYRKLKHK